MSGDLDSIFGVDEETVEAPVEQEAVAQSPTPAPLAPAKIAWKDWLPWGLVCILLVMMQFRACDRSGSGPSPVDPIVDKMHVLIVEDVEKRNELDQSQIAIFSSTDVRDWYDKNGVPYRRIDVKDDLSRDDKIWSKLKSEVTEKPPVVVMADKRGGVQIKLPRDVESHIRALENFKAGKRK